MFKSNVIKKADIILVAALIAIGLAASVFLSSSSTAGETVLVTVDGKEYGTYNLLEDSTISIAEDGRKNTVVIENGSVHMHKSNCRGKDCLRQGKISQTSQAIICLPHKLIVEIKGASKQYDSISK